MRVGSIDLTIDSQFQNVFLVGLAVQRICSSIPLSEQLAYEMEMGVVEGVNNAIEYACHNQPGHPITVRINLSEDRIIFIISDSGDAVGCLREMPALATAALAHPLERGRGVQIMRAVMDEVVYRSDGTLNLLTMIKYLSAARAGGA